MDQYRHGGDTLAPRPVLKRNTAALAGDPEDFRPFVVARATPSAKSETKQQAINPDDDARQSQTKLDKTKP